VFFYYPDFDAKIAPLTLPADSPAAKTQPTAGSQAYSLLANQQHDKQQASAQAAQAAPSAAPTTPQPNAQVENEASIGSVASAARSSASQATAEQLSNMAFGQYIAEKWAQVNRQAKPTTY
jgi:hypothetical protein